MDTKTFSVCICLAVTVLISSVDGQVLMEELKLHDLTPYKLNGSEIYTEKTIDQIIMQAMGGPGRAQNMMLGDDGKILAELDMYLTQEQYHYLYEPNFDQTLTGRKKRRVHNPRRTKRKAIRDVILRWPNATVPFTFVNNHFSEEEQYNIGTSMTEWERYTCLKFRAANVQDRNKVRFQDGMGCNSQLGMVGGSQALNLDRNGCRFKGLYLHEIAHAVGLVHEHQLPNRDEYIRVIYGNVQPNMRVWFNKYSAAEVDQMDVEYEYSSVMHYGITAFSIDNKAQTIEAKVADKEKSIGRVYKKQLGFSDVKIVNRMYDCASHCPANIACYGRGFVDQNCKCICPDGTDSCSKSQVDRSNEDPSCFDSHDPWQCYVWSNQGECERNPKFMLDMCRKSCKLCGEKEKPKENTCKDVFESKRCQTWKDRGECVVNKVWMAKNCKNTCKACGDNSNDPDVACDNVHADNSQCDKWASEGECFINSNWMPQNCRKSCHMCADSGKTPTTQSPKPDPDAGKCEDDYNSVECARWAADDECDKNPSWMIPNCRQSCRKCDNKQECKNLHDDKRCVYWAGNEECNRNRIWMHANCAKACKVCTPPDDGGETPPTTSRPRTTTSGGIKNNHKNQQECDNWADHGHCDINQWMLKHCALSCQRHTVSLTTTRKPDIDNGGGGGGGGGGGDGGGGGGGGGNDGGSCRDQEEHCKAWAENNFCEDNPSSALRICQKSCNVCTNSRSDCFDKHQLCPVWASGHQCNRNSGYMLVNCRKSCGTC